MSREIKTVIYPEQCPQYYEAKERGDVYAMHIWFQPPIYRPWKQIKSDMRFQEIVDTYKSEMKRIEETPNELLRIELEMKFKSQEPKKRIPTLLERIFGAK